jgi:hypothetical protein
VVGLNNLLSEAQVLTDKDEGVIDLVHFVSPIDEVGSFSIPHEDRPRACLQVLHYGTASTPDGASYWGVNFGDCIGIQPSGHCRLSAAPGESGSGLAWC